MRENFFCGPNTGISSFSKVDQMANDKRKPKPKHGGRRDGAGRKRKMVDPTFPDQATIDLLIADGPSDQVEIPAQRYARTAVLSLVKTMLNGGSESARVTAANSILDRGYGKPAVDIGGDAAPNLFSLLPPERAAAGFEVVSIEVRTEAKKYAKLALEVLRLISEFGRSESARVSASTSLLNRGCGTVGTAKLPDDLKETRLGKKETALMAARTAASGKYATPAPPKGLTEESSDEGKKTKH
jgi:hypothetical protein